MRAVWIVALVFVLVGQIAVQAQIVTCTATEGFHCAPGTGCSSDATYTTEYRVDLDAMTVDELTVQHTQRDPQPKRGSTSYTIVRSTPATALSGEESITAVGRPGSAAVETILIGDKSYLSSSVSSSGTRIFVMMGACTGF